MHLVDNASVFLAGHHGSIYFILLLSIIIEGEIALIVLGILTHTKIIPVEIALLIAIFGATIKSTAGYAIGYLLKQYIPKNKLFDFIEKRVHMVFPHFSSKPFWSLFFSKFIYGLNHFTIIFAGYIRSRLKTYITAEIVSSLLWIAIMFSIGYFFSAAAFAISHDLKRVALYLALGIIAFLLVERIVGFIIEYFESED